MIKKVYGNKLKPNLVGYDLVIDGKHIVAKRKDEYSYSVVGGHLEDGENSLLGSLRELKEETGLIVEDNKIKEYPWQLTDGSIVAQPYRVELEISEFSPKIGDKDIAELVACSDEELKEILKDERFHPISREFYKAILEVKQ